MQPLLLWRRYVKEGADAVLHGQQEGRTAGYNTYVIDGQQRLMALDAMVYRADGRLNPRSAAFFDMETGEWGVACGAMRGRVADLLTHNYDAIRSEDAAAWREAMYRAHFEDRIGGVQLVTYTLEDRATPEDVVEAFRSINHPGTPIPPEDIEVLLNAAKEPW